MPIMVFPNCFTNCTKFLISGLSPLLLMIKTISLACIIPESPCIASAACKYNAGVPVELKVATIFCAMMALFPIPLMTNLPLLFKMAVTAFSKEASIYLFNSTKASDSIANAFFAMVIMFSFIFDFSY